MDTVDRIFELADKQFSEQRDFAIAIDVAASVVSAWRVRKSNSYNKRLAKIADLLGTTPDYLLTGEKKEPTPVTESGPRDPLEAQLMNLVRQLSPDSKKMLIAQLEVLLRSQSP